MAKTRLFCNKKKNCFAETLNKLNERQEVAILGDKEPSFSSRSVSPLRMPYC